MTPADFQHLCRLARLAPDETKRDLIAAQCSTILAYMDTLAEVDTGDVEPMYSPTLCLDDAAAHGEGQALVRPDMAERRRSREDILAGAPASDGTFFVVPRIVEGKS